MNKVVVGLGVVAVLAYLATGVVVVEPNEEVVIRRFGKAHRLSLPSGLHFELPRGFSKIDRVRVDSTRQAAIGTSRPEADRGLEIDEPDLSAKGRFLTGDQNLVQLAATVQYTLRDPKAYLFSSVDAERLIAAGAEAELTRLASRLPVDEILLNPQSAIGQPLRAGLEDFLEKTYGLGVAVRSVNVACSPPAEVRDAFEDVARARSDKEKKINDARTYADKTSQQTSAEADRIVNEALTYAERQNAEAESGAERFDDLLAAYRESHQPEGVARRLFLESMERLLPRLKKVLVETDANGETIDLSILRETEK